MGIGLSDGPTLENGLRKDGAGHYRGHVRDVPAWFSGEVEPDDDDPNAEGTADQTAD